MKGFTYDAGSLTISATLAALAACAGVTPPPTASANPSATAAATRRDCVYPRIAAGRYVDTRSVAADRPPPRRPARARRRLAGQAPAHPRRGRPDAAHALPDGRVVAAVPDRRALAGWAGPPGTGRPHHGRVAGRGVPAARGRAPAHGGRGQRRRAPGSRPAGTGLGPGRGGTPARDATGPARRRGAARPAQPGRHPQRVRERSP